MKRWTRKLLAGLLSFGMLLQVASPLSALAADSSSAAPGLTVTVNDKAYTLAVDSSGQVIVPNEWKTAGLPEVSYAADTYTFTGRLGNLWAGSETHDNISIIGSDTAKPNVVLNEGNRYQTVMGLLTVENVNNFTSTGEIYGAAILNCDGDVNLADGVAVGSLTVQSANNVTVAANNGSYTVSGDINITCSGDVEITNSGNGTLTNSFIFLNDITGSIKLSGGGDDVAYASATAGMLYLKNCTGTLDITSNGTGRAVLSMSCTDNTLLKSVTINSKGTAAAVGYERYYSIDIVSSGEVKITNTNGPVAGGNLTVKADTVTLNGSSADRLITDTFSADISAASLTAANSGTGAVGQVKFTKTGTGDYYIVTGDSASSASQTKMEGEVHNPGTVSAKYLRISTDEFVPAPATPYGFSVNGTSVTAENAETTLPDGMTYDKAANKLTATKDITGDLTIEVTDPALKLDVSLQSVTGDVTLLGVNDVDITGTVNGMLTVGAENAYASGNVTVNGQLLGGTEINCIGDVKATGSSDGGILKTKDLYQPDIIRCNGTVYLENTGKGYTTCSLTVIGATDVTVKANGGFHAAISGEGDITCSGTVTLTTTGVRAMGSNDPLTYTPMQGGSYTVQLDDQTPFTRTGTFNESEVNLLSKVKSIIITPTGSTPAPGPDDGDTTPDDTGAVDSGSDAGGAVAAVLVGSAAVWGGYEIATRVILHNILPEGTAIPANRGQLALLVWNNAGRPAPVNEPAFADMDDADMAKAAQWCVEQGIMEAKNAETFKPEGWTPKLKVIEVWNKAFPKQ